MPTNFSNDDLLLIAEALMTLRKTIENEQGPNEKFMRCAHLADQLAGNPHQLGAVLTYLAPDKSAE